MFSTKRAIGLLLVLSLLLAMLAGCGSSSTTDDADDTTAEETTEETTEAEETEEAETTEDADSAEGTEDTAASEDAAADEASDGSKSAASISSVSYPLDVEEGYTFTYYMIKDLGTASSLGDWNEHPMLEVIQEKTGIKIEIQAVSQTNGSELMALMLSAGDYPDMIENLTYSTGFAAAMDDDIVLDITDMIEEYAPDYYSLLSENEDYMKSVSTDDGRIGIFATITEGSRGPSDGLIINQDWLDELGLDTPVTFDDLEEVLTAFKNTYDDITDPLYMVGDGVLDNDQLAASFGIALKFDSITGEGGFYVDEDGVVQFGYMQEGYAEYVTLMHDWYEKGLISSDFVSNSTDYMNDDLINGVIAQQVGVYAKNDGTMDMLRGASGSNLVALADPVLEEGDTIHLGNSESMPSTSGGVVITTGCEDPELCCQFLNWWYTEDGYIAGTYGEEGVSFEYDENGDPQYTEMMTNTDGTTLSSQKIDYCGPLQLLVDGTIAEPSYSEVAQEAPLIWGSNKDGAYEIPDAVELTTDEGDEFNRLFSDISTLCQEYTVKFITGAIDLSEIEAFQAQLEEMGVQTCCDLYQAALDRYNSR